MVFWSNALSGDRILHCLPNSPSKCGGMVNVYRAINEVLKDFGVSTWESFGVADSFINFRKSDRVIVHGLWSFNSLFLLFIGRKKIFAYLHGAVDPMTLRRRTYIKRWVLFFLRLNKDVVYIAGSEFERRNVRRVFRNNKVSVLYPFVPSSVIPEARIVREGFSRCINLLYSGRIGDEKHIRQLVSIVRETAASSSSRQQFILTLVGKIDYGFCLHSLRPFSSPNFKLVYRSALDHDDYLKTLDQFDIYISLSLSESFGLSVAEASIAGMPVISYNTGWMSDGLASQNIFKFERFEDVASILLDLVSKDSSEFSREVLLNSRVNLCNRFGYREFSSKLIRIIGE